MTLLIFDCDGVLVDSEFLHSQIESDIGRDMVGVNRNPWEHNRIFSGMGLKNVYQAWERETGKALPSTLDSELARRKAEAFSTILKPIPYVIDALQELNGIPRCVASGTPLPTLEIALRTAGLYDFFAPNLFSSSMVARGKPAPDIFLHAAREMGAEPKDCLVIEDSMHGVAAALAAGMPVIGFAGGSHCAPCHAEKLQGAMSVITDMRQLPKVVKEFLRKADCDEV
jgi:HAD superfamily hydrolase (TIGR01509 family)